MKLVSEIFEEIESTRSINQKKDILSGHQRAGFLSVLQHMFDRNIKFAIKKIPEYRPSAAPLGLEDSYLEKSMKDLRLFYTNSNVSEERMKIILIQILESLNPKEAEILCKIITGKIKVSGLTERLVREVHPDLLPEASGE
tara:strand:+ start:3652 stop:4074 length:423 start_codon:yes stop_codon:yes gene_type:complete